MTAPNASTTTAPPADGAGAQQAQQSGTGAAADGGGQSNGTAQPDSTTIAGNGASAMAEGRAGAIINDYLNAARSAVVAGDLVAGAKYVYNIGAQRREPLRRLPAGRMDAVRRAFVQPGGWTDLCDAVGDRQTIILRGRPGCGKA